MLVFRKGKWHSVELPFSDPMLTEGHKAAAAAVCVNEMMKGTSFDVAVATAEKAMYDVVLNVNTFRGLGHVRNLSGTT